MSREVSVNTFIYRHKFLRTLERLLPNASPNPNQKIHFISNVSDGEDNCARVKL